LNLTNLKVNFHLRALSSKAYRRQQTRRNLKLIGLQLNLIDRFIFIFDLRYPHEREGEVKIMYLGMMDSIGYAVFPDCKQLSPWDGFIPFLDLSWKNCL
jgi:hypothetical protein